MMSCFDKIDLFALTKECCVLAVQRRVQLAAAGDLLACGCGQKILFTDGRWRRAKDEFRTQTDRP